MIEALCFIQKLFTLFRLVTLEYVVWTILSDVEIEMWLSLGDLTDSR